jgi:lipoyl(octanoyl) transferase
MTPLPAPRCAVHRLGLIDYLEAQALQRRLGDGCRERGEQHLLLLEHPPTYTLGARGKQEHLLLPDDALTRLGAVVHRVNRGGDITFHGPGQLVGYPIIDLNRWRQGPLWYVRALEAVLLETLASFGIDASRLPGRPGAWLGREKIASIGVHVLRGITSHGFALNVEPDLSFFSHIVPCGLPDITMTSMAKRLDCHSEPSEESDPSRESPHPLAMPDVMDAVVRAFANVFDIEMEDGNRVVTPEAWTPAMAL